MFSGSVYLSGIPVIKIPSRTIRSRTVCNIDRSVISVVPSMISSNVHIRIRPLTVTKKSPTICQMPNSAWHLSSSESSFDSSRVPKTSERCSIWSVGKWNETSDAPGSSSHINKFPRPFSTTVWYRIFWISVSPLCVRSILLSGCPSIISSSFRRM